MVGMITLLVVNLLSVSSSREKRVLQLQHVRTSSKYWEHIADLISANDAPMELLKHLHNHSKLSHEIDIANAPSLESNISRTDIGINVLRRIYSIRNNNKSTVVHTGNVLPNVRVPIQFPTTSNFSALTLPIIQYTKERYVYVCMYVCMYIYICK